MRYVVTTAALALLWLAACSQPDPVQEINELAAAGRVSEAKVKYKEALEKNPDRGLTRQFVQFLFDNKHYRDFIKQANEYLDRYPEDNAVKHLRFEYYAMLAGDAERQGQYNLAIEYIVAHLLSPDYRDYLTWESRQVDVFKNWFAAVEKEGSVVKQKDVLTRMKNLGFGNLAQTLAPDLYAELDTRN